MTAALKHVLVTGGAGYIGSHTCVELLGAGYDVSIVDNLSNSRRDSVRAIESIAGRSVTFHDADLRDPAALGRIFAAQPIDAVIHFAGLKAVGESTAKPLEYYDNNVYGTLSLLETMRRAQVECLVFSSSATVYGEPQHVPIAEDHPLAPVSPYGKTKFMVEEILRDLHHAEPSWRLALLRYFNPVGAHPSGDIGEDPSDVPNNLMPLITQVAVGRRASIAVYGDDYPTPDGTGVRDYVHVVDLARGHLRALEALAAAPAIITCNLGTGRGYSVLDVIRTFENVNGVKVAWQKSARRPGDVATCYADASAARDRLGWSAENDLAAMCRDAWRWQKQHPNGYGSGDGTTVAERSGAR